jgi:6-phosphogluconolactonase (cycloisomerase 2 family)
MPFKVQSLGVDTGALAADPSGRFLVAAAGGAGSSRVASCSIDRTTGRLTLRGTLPLPARFPHTMSVDPSGAFLYVSMCCDSSSPGDDGEVRAIAIDASTGLLRDLGPVAAGGDAGLTVVRLP